MKRTTETAIRESIYTKHGITGETAVRENREYWTAASKAALSARDADDAATALAYARAAIQPAIMAVETAACSYASDKGDGKDPFARAFATAACD